MYESDDEQSKRQFFYHESNNNKKTDNIENDHVYTGLAPKLTSTASVAQSVERWSRDPGSRVQFPAGGLGVAFFTTGRGWVLKCISF